MLSMNKQLVAVAPVVALAGSVNAALNGTALAAIVTEAFIVITGLLNSVIALVPTLIEMSIYFAILGTVVGFFALLLWLVRTGVSKGIKM